MRMMIVMCVVLMSTSALAERLRAPDGTVREVPDASVDYALKDGYTRIPSVWMRDPQGRAYQMYEDAVADLERDGWWKMTPSEARDEESRRSSDVVNSEERRHLWYGVVGIGGAMIVMLWLLKPWRYFRAG